MNSGDDIDIKVIDARLQEAKRLVVELEEKFMAMPTQITKARHRLEVIRDFYNLELDRHGSDESEVDTKPLFDVPARFANITVREACKTILQEKGPLHVSEIHRLLKEGGRDTKKPAITTTLLRAKEFEKLLNHPNTFRFTGPLTVTLDGPIVGKVGATAME